MGKRSSRKRKLKKKKLKKRKSPAAPESTESDDDSIGSIPSIDSISRRSAETELSRNHRSMALSRRRSRPEIDRPCTFPSRSSHKLEPRRTESLRRFAKHPLSMFKRKQKRRSELPSQFDHALELED